jgi:hypothetical protein
MPELSSLLRQRLRAGENARLQHPDADTLTAYVEQLLPANERKLVLQHIALCGDCREIVFLATPEDALVAGPEAPETVAPVAVASPFRARRHWFQSPRFGLAASIAAMAAALTLVIELPHKNQPLSTPPPATGQVSNTQASKASDAKEDAQKAVVPNVAAPVDSNAIASSQPASKPSAPGSFASANAAGAMAAQPLNSRASTIPEKSRTVAASAGALHHDARQSQNTEATTQVATNQVTAGTRNGVSESIEVTAAAPVLQANVSRQDYLNAQRFPKDAAESITVAPAQANLPSAPPVSINGLASAKQTTLLPGNWQQANNAYLVSPEAQQQASQGVVTFTPKQPEHQSLLSKIVDVGKHPAKRVEPSIQAGNALKFAMFDKGVAVDKGEAVAANNATETADSSNLASSPAFTSRGFGSSRKAFLGAAPTYRWKVAQGKLLRSADAVIWLEGYSVAEGIEFSAVHSIGSEIWAGGNHGQLVHSTDGGTKWEKVTLGDPSAGKVVSIDGTGLNVHVMTSPAQGWSSADGGKTWTKLP